MRVFFTLIFTLFIFIWDVSGYEYGKPILYRKYREHGYEPLKSYLSVYHIDLPEMVEGIGSGHSYSEAEDNAIISCLKSIGCEVTAFSENVVVEDNNNINERYISISQVKTRAKRFSGYKVINSKIHTSQHIIKRKKRYGGDSVVIEHTYEVRCCFEPRKYVYDKLVNEKDRKYIDSLLHYSTLKHGSWMKTTTEKMVYGEKAEDYDNFSINFRIGNLYMAYQKLDDDLLEYLLPWVTDIKQEIKEIVFEKLCHVKVGLTDVIKKNNSLVFVGLDQLEGVPFELEYSVDGGQWRPTNKRESRQSTLFRQQFDIVRYYLSDKEKGNIVEKRVRFRVPYFFVQEDGTKGEINNIPDDWYLNIIPENKF